MSAHEFATLTTDDLVTGEAVALDLPPAGLGTRMASGLIDVAVTLGLLLAIRNEWDLITWIAPRSEPAPDFENRP